MLKSVIVTFCLASMAQAATTSVQDTLYQADGVTKYNGVLQISWPTFQSSDSQQHPAGTLTTNINNGVLRQSLQPTDTVIAPVCSPACPIYYNVRYQLSNGANVVQCWSVPTSGSPVNLATVVVLPSICGTAPPSTGLVPPSSIQPGGANTVLTTNGALMVQWLPPSQAGLPIFVGPNYNFTPQMPGGSLVIGNNTISLTPVPLGMNGSDSYHRVWISNGTGTAEACLINGGSGTGGTNGSIRINCANTHSGAWTIQSIDGGLQEAAQAATTSGGGVVFCSAGTYTSFAALQLQSNVILDGVPSCVVQAASGLLGRTTQWTNGGIGAPFYCIVCAVQSAVNVVIRNITVDENGSTQTYSYISGDIETFDNVNSTIQNVVVQNRQLGGTGVAVGIYGSQTSPPYSLNYGNRIVGSTVNAHPGGCIAGSPIAGGGGGAYFIEGEGSVIAASYAINFCDSPYVLLQCDHCVVSDSTADLGAGQMATPTFQVAGATYSSFDNDQCIATRANAHLYCVGIDSTTSMQTFGIRVIGVSGSHISTLIEVGLDQSVFGGTTPVINTTIMGVHADTASADCIVLSKYVSKIDIIGGDLESCGASGINISSTGSGVGTTVTNVLISGVKIDHVVNFSIAAANTSTGPPVNGLTITNNLLCDTTGSPRTQYGVLIEPGLVDDVVITGNRMLGCTTASSGYQNTWGSHVIIGPNTEIVSTDANQVSAFAMGGAVSSGTTITPTANIFHVTGTTTIATINAHFPNSACITMIPDGLWSTSTGGNIAIASTAVVSKALVECYDPATSKWYPSY